MTLTASKATRSIYNRLVPCMDRETLCQYDSTGYTVVDIDVLNGEIVDVGGMEDVPVENDMQRRRDKALLSRKGMLHGKWHRKTNYSLSPSVIERQKREPQHRRNEDRIDEFEQTENDLDTLFFESRTGTPENSSYYAVDQSLMHDEIVNSFNVMSIADIVNNPELYDTSKYPYFGNISRQFVNSTVSFCPKNDDTYCDAVVRNASDFDLNIVNVMSFALGKVVSSWTGKNSELVTSEIEKVVDFCAHLTLLNTEKSY
eukprot:3936271-Rhodomonas_salina.1